MSRRAHLIDPIPKPLTNSATLSLSLTSPTSSPTQKRLTLFLSLSQQQTNKSVIPQAYVGWISEIKYYLSIYLSVFSRTLK
jgi:hypothetical protein